VPKLTTQSDTAPPRNIAIFDLDYTLTQKGTWGRFVVSCVKSRPLIWGPTLLAAGLAQLKYKRGKAERVTVKQAMIRKGMAGMSRSEITERAEQFAEAEVQSGLRPGAIEALKTHKAKGDIIIIASAAADAIVAAIAERLDVVYWIATDMGWDADDKLIPEFSSPNCYGPEKVVRMNALYAAHPILTENIGVTTMYTDSYSDLEILLFADVGVAVHPDKKLTKYAQENDIQIVDWS